MQAPVVIGLTGNIATGKSRVMETLREFGARTIDADRVVHQLMYKGEPGYEPVVRAFGEKILGGDGTIDRRKLGAIVFSDPTSLGRLEGIIHPLVFRRVRREIEAASEPVVVFEAIKLLEAGMSLALCDEVWVVTAPPELQLQRLVEQRGLAEEEARRRMAAQSPQAAKVNQADVVIRNDGDLEHLRQQVREAWEGLLRRKRLRVESG